MLESELYLQMHVKNFRGSPPKSWRTKTAYFVTVLMPDDEKYGRMSPPSVNARHDYGDSGIKMAPRSECKWSHRN